MSRLGGIMAMLGIWGMHVTAPIVFEFGNVGYSVSGWIAGCMFMSMYHIFVVRNAK